MKILIEIRSKFKLHLVKNRRINRLLCGVTIIALFTACATSPDLAMLNRDPRCLHPGDVFYGNRKRNNEEFFIQTFSVDERQFVEVVNRLGDTLGYRDIYGTELTNADLDEIGPFSSDINPIQRRLGLWQARRKEFLEFPQHFPNRGKPYRALIRPEFCNRPMVNMK